MTGLSRSRLACIAPYLQAQVDRGAIAGAVALVARGDTAHVDAVGVQDLSSGAPMRRDTIFRIASMTKAITAAAMMTLVEEARIALDDPVDEWLPELANRRVLRSLESPLDDTVPAARSITVRDLLTLRLGLGIVMAPPDSYPIQTAMADAGVAPGPDLLDLTPDLYMTKIGRLPLMHQPGEKWMYHTGADIMGVLIARIAGMPLDDVLRDRIFAPLGMRDTGFSVPEGSVDRLAACYSRDGETLKLWDAGRGGVYTRPQTFPNALVSTVDDFWAFCRMLNAQGRYAGGRLLSRAAVKLMMSDQISEAQKAASPFFPGFWDNKGWGFGASVITRRDNVNANPGSYGWSGGFGTSFIADPGEDLTAIVMIQRLMGGPADSGINETFMTLAYQASDS